MYARIAKFEGHEPGDIDEMVEMVKADVESGERPEGMEDSKGVLLLVDRDAGTSMGIVFFGSEEGLRSGDAALNDMSPGEETKIRRTGVETYEVAYMYQES